MDAHDLRRAHNQEKPSSPLRPGILNAQSVKSTNQALQDAYCYYRWRAHRCARRRAKTSGRKPLPFAHPFTLHPQAASVRTHGLGSVGLASRVSPKPCGTSERFDARCVRLATASHRRFTSTQHIEESRLDRETCVSRRSEGQRVSRRSCPASDWSKGA